MCPVGDEENTPEFTTRCIFENGQDCTKYFYPIKDLSITPILDQGYIVPSCQIFLPPLDINFQVYKDIPLSKKEDLMYILLLKKNTTSPLKSFYFSYYTSQNSPYRTFFGMNGNDSSMPLQDAEDWIEEETRTGNLKGSFRLDAGGYVTAPYSLTETRTLTSSIWNYFGFASIYNTRLNITLKVGDVAKMADSSTEVWLPSSFLYINPSEYSLHLIKEQRVSTILSGLASAGGVFNVIMAIQTLLFGFRPDSSWGIVHRMSWGRRSKTLKEDLRNQFNTNNSPVPMVSRVRGEYYSLPELSHSTALEIVPVNISDGHHSEGLKLRKMEDRFQLMEDRFQLMEDLFKTYYINDEVFRKLSETTQYDVKMNGKGEKQVTNESG